MKVVAITVIAAVLNVMLIGFVIYGMLATGPDCPGHPDPTYRGWCP